MQFGESKCCPTTPAIHCVGDGRCREVSRHRQLITLVLHRLHRQPGSSLQLAEAFDLNLESPKWSQASGEDGRPPQDAPWQPRLAEPIRMEITALPKRGAAGSTFPVQGLPQLRATPVYETCCKTQPFPEAFKEKVG